MARGQYTDSVYEARGAIPIYIGVDDREMIAYHVLCHSILRRASMPVYFYPLYRPLIQWAYWRPRGEKDSTDFSNSRFMVPFLANYKGWAIFMDCDMLCTTDIRELWEQRPPYTKARVRAPNVLVKKHDHDATNEAPKFLNTEQMAYPRKNWSSLMLLHCARAANQLTVPYVNTVMPALRLHRFDWLPDEKIGAIEGSWNFLSGVQPRPDEVPKLIHYTRGGPWHGIYTDFYELWLDEFENMMYGSNPIRWNPQPAIRDAGVASLPLPKQHR